MDTSHGQKEPVTHRESSWRARCGANSHGGFGERAGETVQAQAWNRAPVRFHWATEALDEERRASWNHARHQAADPDLARKLKHSRHALWKNPEDLTERQSAKLAWIAANDPRLHRAYLLKEGLRTIYRIAKAEGVRAATEALDRWLSWARRCRIPAFVELGRKVRRHYDAILHAIVEELSNEWVSHCTSRACFG